MSVVNKMLKDLDERSASEDAADADYHEPAESKRIRYMVVFIVLIVLSASGYFTYRAMGQQYFIDLYVSAKTLIQGEEQKQANTKQVRVNSALDQMMPTRANNPATTQANATNQAVPDNAAKTLENQNSSSDSDPQTSNTDADEALLADSRNTGQPPMVAQSPVDEQQAAIQAESDVQMPGELTTEQPTGNNELIAAENQTVSESQDDLSSTTEPEQNKSTVRVTNAIRTEMDINELLSMAAKAVADNSVVQAINLYQQVLDIDVKRHEIRKKLAVLLYSDGSNGAASVVLAEGVEVAPERTDFRLMLARLFYREKKLKAAYGVLDGLEPDVARNIDYYGLKATVAQELERTAEASHLYGRLVIFEPNRAQWWLGLAISLDRLGQREGALKAYENAADLRQLSASANDFIKQRILELGG